MGKDRRGGFAARREQRPPPPPPSSSSSPRLTPFPCVRTLYNPASLLPTHLFWEKAAGRGKIEEGKLGLSELLWRVGKMFLSDSGKDLLFQRGGEGLVCLLLLLLLHCLCYLHNAMCAPVPPKMRSCFCAAIGEGGFFWRLSCLPTGSAKRRKEADARLN